MLAAQNIRIRISARARPTIAAQSLTCLRARRHPFSTTLADIGVGTPAGTLPLLGPDGTAGTYIRPTTLRLPTVDAWNASYQRQVTATLSLTVSYVGNKGTHGFAGTGPSYNTNQIAVGPGTNIVTFTCSVAITPCPAADQVPSLGGFYSFRTSNNRRRFFPERSAFLHLSRVNLHDRWRTGASNTALLFGRRQQLLR